MATNAKLNVGSDLRRLSADELDMVSGSQAPQITTAASGSKGLYRLDLQTVIWERQFRGPKHLAIKHLAMAAGT